MRRTGADDRSCSGEQSGEPVLLGAAAPTFDGRRRRGRLAIVASDLVDHDFEVLAGHDQTPAVTAIELCERGRDVLGERRLALTYKASKAL
jgi:hypothetical protein